jgi:nucleoside-diphosphate-sugar epimerase
MKILVTGAGGFLGKRLVACLAEDGHEVIALVRASPAGRDVGYFAHRNIRKLRQDLTRLDAATLPQGVEALVTLAQSSNFRDFPAQAEEVFAVNVTANLQLLRWAMKSGVRRVVHASSGGIYGGKQGGPYIETDLLAVDSPLGFYLGSKLCAEVVLQNYRQFFDATVILRPFFVYGPRQRKDMFVARMIDAVRHGKPISLQGSDGLRVNPIHVDDAADAFRAALALKGAHVINLAGPDVLTLRQLAEAIGRVVGRTPVYETRPGAPVDYVGDTAAAAAKLGSAAIGFEQGIAFTRDSEERS